MHDILVKGLMSKEVVCVPPTASIHEVLLAMMANRCSCVVVTENDIPVGIATEFDVVRLMADATVCVKPLTGTASDMMSRPVVTITEETSLFDALVFITSRKFRHLPVVDLNGRVSGIVTLVDLAQAHFQTFERQREVIEHSITVRTRDLLEANERLKALSLVDGLLGIGNRRAMEVDLEVTHAQSCRHRRLYSVALLDLDHFKRYNDHYGHLAGDAALKQAAQFVAKCIRTSDRLYRYGGEELLLLLPETSTEGADILLNRIIHGLAELAIPHSESPFKVLTMSCGITTFPGERGFFNSWYDVVAQADRALYKSKQEGRNMVTTIDTQRFGDVLNSFLFSEQRDATLVRC